MRFRPWLRGLSLFTVGTTFLAAAGVASAGQTNLQETMPLVWVLTFLSAAGAALTFGALIWTIWKFRDPTTRGRRHG